MKRVSILAALCAALLAPSARADWQEAGDGSWTFVPDASDAPSIAPAKSGCGCDNCTCPAGACPDGCPSAVTLPGIQSTAAPCYIDPKTGRQVCPAQQRGAGVVAVAAAPVRSVIAARPVRGLFGRVVDRVRNRGRLFSGGCSSCGQ